MMLINSRVSGAIAGGIALEYHLHPEEFMFEGPDDHPIFSVMDEYIRDPIGFRLQSWEHVLISTLAAASTGVQHEVPMSVGAVECTLWTTFGSLVNGGGIAGVPHVISTLYDVVDIQEEREWLSDICNVFQTAGCVPSESFSDAVEEFENLTIIDPQLTWLMGSLAGSRAGITNIPMEILKHIHLGTLEKINRWTEHVTGVQASIESQQDPGCLVLSK